MNGLRKGAGGRPVIGMLRVSVDRPIASMPIRRSGRIGRGQRTRRPAPHWAFGIEIVPRHAGDRSPAGLAALALPQQAGVPAIQLPETGGDVARVQWDTFDTWERGCQMRGHGVA